MPISSEENGSRVGSVSPVAENRAEISISRAWVFPCNFGFGACESTRTIEHFRFGFVHGLRVGGIHAERMQRTIHRLVDRTWLNEQFPCFLRCFEQLQQGHLLFLGAATSEVVALLIWRIHFDSTRVAISDSLRSLRIRVPLVFLEGHHLGLRREITSDRTGNQQQGMRGLIILRGQFMLLGISKHARRLLRG